MDTADLKRWTGTAGIVGTILQVVALGPFFTAGEPPSGTDPNQLVSYLSRNSSLIETSLLLSLLGFGVIAVFLGGLWGLLQRAGQEHAWLATATFGLGIITLVMGYAAYATIGAAAADASSRADPGTARTLYILAGVLGGATTAMPVAFFLAVTGWALARTALLGRWAVWLSEIAAILVLATVPAIYGGDDASAFYSATGIVTVLALLPLYAWTLAISIGILRSRRI